MDRNQTSVNAENQQGPAPAQPPTLTKRELRAQIAEKAGFTQQEAGAMLNALVDSISEHLGKGGKVRLGDFGAFTIRILPPRSTTLPHKPNERIQIPPIKTVVFTPFLALRQRLEDAP